MKNQITKIVLALLISLSFANAQSSKKHKALVLEAFNSGGYTYVKVLENKKDYWVAVKTTNVKKGEEFSFTEQVWMSDFTSKTLNKTFDKILFAVSNNEEDANNDIYGLKEKSIFLPTTKTTKIEKKDSTKVSSVSKGGISEILSNTAKFKDKTIIVKGEVVKVSRGIMKTSWVHIKDENNNKLIFRAAKESVSVGDKVEARGVLNTDVDYGYGYTYKVIVVDSTFTKI